MEKIVFGTGGWRAVIGEDFIKENIYRVGQGVADLAHEAGRADLPIVIGYDRRFLSDHAAKWLAEVLTANGIKVWCMKRSTPSPLVMHVVKTQKFWYGLEITASHNPAEFNGIKLFVEEGRDAPIEVTSHLEDLIAAATVRTMPYEKAEAAGLVEYHTGECFNNFIDDILAKLDLPAIRKRGLRIAFDPMHGSGTYALLTVLCTARCTVDVINQNKDAYFGSGSPAPSTTTIRPLAFKVASEGYDLGISFDGDGDRIGIVDEKGEYIEANEILSLLYWYLHEYKGWKGPVVRNCATTHILDRIAASFGEQCYEVPVGFKWISAKLDETDAVLGGESSGGLTVRGHIFGKDSCYAASLFVEMVCATGKTASELRALLRETYGKTSFVDRAVRFAPADKARVNAALIGEKRLPSFAAKVEKVSYMDGCKVYFADGGFVICRFSGTEPLLRIMAEAADAETATGYIAAFEQLVQDILR